MAKRKAYASYEPWIKAAIAATGKTDLFPHLKIPRMTARHWADQDYVIEDPALESMIWAVNSLQESQRELAATALEKTAATKLIKNVIEALGFRLRWKHVESRETQAKILDLITEAMVYAGRDVCLETLDLSLSRFKRWRRERKGCGLPQTKRCPRGALAQLTFQEIKIMGDLVTSERFSHYPIRSLHYYAKRKGFLFCTYSTWRKYINQYGWLRVRKKRRKKMLRIGIRAKRPNEIWHLDLSYFILPDGTKCFIQAVIDNYSRYVLAWQVLSSYDGSKTAELLERAVQKLSKKYKNRNLSLIVDGGGENKGPSMKKLEERGRFKKKVARFEISFSNSMVEALFRSLKHNYLFHREIKTMRGLTKAVDFWFCEHNEEIPHTAFKGETPLERFSQSWDEKSEVRILVRHQEAIKLRIEHNQKVFCQLCDVA